MIQTKHQLFSLGIALGLGVAAIGLPQAAFAWEPKKPVEFVVMAGKGGGADKAVRFMQSIIAKNKMGPTISPVNKPGGSGAEALVYMKGKKGDDHTIMFTLNSFYTTLIASTCAWREHRNIHAYRTHGRRYLLSVGEF